MIYGQPSTPSNSPLFVLDKHNALMQGLVLLLALVLVLVLELVLVLMQRVVCVVGWAWGV